MKYLGTKNKQAIPFGNNVLAFLYVVIGLILLIKPMELTRIFCLFIGIAALLYGVVRLFSYYRRTKFDYPAAFQIDLILGVVLLVIGILSLIKPEIILSILPFVLGIILLLDSIGIAQQTWGLRKLGFDKWWLSLLFTLLLFILSITLITNPFETTLLFVRFFGTSLLLDGCFELWGNFHYNNHIRL